MELQNALAGQYRATLAMLLQCVEHCPQTLWESGGPERPFWRIAYHTAFYTHLYLMPTEHDFVPTQGHQYEATCLWGPENIPMEPLSKEFVTNYIVDIDSNVGMYFNEIDLASKSSGFHWYSLPKLDHILLNLRHLGIHVGQLQERLYAEGIDLDWISTR